MGSSPPATRRSRLLAALGLAYEGALLAVAGEDLESAAARGREAGEFLAELAGLRDAPAAAEEALLAQARRLHEAVMASLQAGRDAAAARLREARAFLRQLRSFRPLLAVTGTRLDVTDC